MRRVVAAVATAAAEALTSALAEATDALGAGRPTALLLAGMNVLAATAALHPAASRARLPAEQREMEKLPQPPSEAQAERKRARDGADGAAPLGRQLAMRKSAARATAALARGPTKEKTGGGMWVVAEAPAVEDGD